MDILSCGIVYALDILLDRFEQVDKFILKNRYFWWFVKWLTSTYRLKISKERTTSLSATYGKENKGNPLTSVMRQTVEWRWKWILLATDSRGYVFRRDLWRQINWGPILSSSVDRLSECRAVVWVVLPQLLIPRNHSQHNSFIKLYNSASTRFEPSKPTVFIFILSLQLSNDKNQNIPFILVTISCSERCYNFTRCFEPVSMNQSFNKPSEIYIFRMNLSICSKRSKRISSALTIPELQLSLILCEDSKSIIEVIVTDQREDVDVPLVEHVWNMIPTDIKEDFGKVMWVGLKKIMSLFQIT